MLDESRRATVERRLRGVFTKRKDTPGDATEQDRQNRPAGKMGHIAIAGPWRTGRHWFASCPLVLNGPLGWSAVRGPDRRENGVCESFDGRMRDELLKETLFFGLDYVRTKITEWADDCNRQRPHSSLGYLTPAAYAANFTAICDRLRNLDQLRRSHVAHPAPNGVTSAETLIATG
jgi:hypothetical protein